MKILKQLYFLIGLFFYVTTFSQIGDRDLTIRDSIISFQTMHIHFDKDIYFPGETIWFKAYLYNVSEISFSSTNFYAAIYDEKGKLLQQKQYPIIGGSCYGDFEISDNIQTPKIQFRAFTKAMIMEDSNNVYKKILTLYDKEMNTDSIAISNIKELHFFPEGGQMISELQNYIAFKASYPDGSPAMINGQIIEVERNKVIDTFYTNKMGLGKLILFPEPRKNYIAIWKDENGIMQQTLLPANNRYGVSFHTEIINKELQYTIAKNKSSDSLSDLHLLAQMGNYHVYQADLSIPNEMELYKARFPIEAVPAGLMQLTLFNKYWNPLQQRLVFIIDSSFKNQPVVNADSINTKPKGRNTIEISLTDTMITDLSASIADINFYKQPNTYSITQDLYFNTQLEELNQNTDSLLKADNNKTLSLITLTHDWKKYNWQKLVTKSEQKKEPLDNYISLSINYKEKNHALPKDDVLNLVIKNNGLGNQFYNLKPISQTAFKKTGLIFFDSVKILYQMDKNKELVKNLTINKDDSLKATSVINALPAQVRFVPAKQITYIDPLESFVSTTKKFNSLQTLKEVIVKSKYKGNPQQARNDELDKFYTTGMFSGNVKGYQLNLIDDPMAEANNNLLDYIRFRVPGLSILNGDIGVKRKIESYDSRGNYIIKDTIFRAITFIDEVEMESSDLQLLNISNVAYVKYIPGIVIGAGFNAVNGAIYVYTKKGNEKSPPLKGLPFVYVKGYNFPNDFIIPDYTDKDLLQAPDLRTTLYWSPNIMLDKTNNKIKIEYYNNDVSKKLLLRIEGINEAGKLIHIEKVIE